MTQGILTGVLILALAAALLPGLYYLNRLRRMQETASGIIQETAQPVFL